jgi:replicative DNA helicase
MSDAPDLRKGRRNGPAPKVDRLPPSNLEAEQGVLGCILIDPETCLPICVDTLRPDSMYDLRNREIYESLVSMYDQRVPIDMLTVMSRLKDRNKLEAVGGVNYLASLPDTVPSAANLEWYTKIVSEKYRLRKIIQIATGVVSRVYDSETGPDVESIIDEAERDLMKMSDGIGQVQIPRMVDAVNRAMNTIEMMHQNNGVITGLATGFVDLDKLTTGLHGGDVFVIAARPGMGKTSLAMNIAETASVDHQVPVGVFSLEMTVDSLMIRLICSRARVNIRNIREGFLADRDVPRLTAAAGKLSTAPLYIDDSSGISILQLRSKARRMARQYGIKLFVVDYLQLMHSSSHKVDNRQQEVADISRGVKDIAKELDVPIIVLSQLNRELERDGKRKPRLADLRESGAIEQDADIVGLLYYPKMDKEDDDNGYQETAAVNLLIAKQRNGASGVDVALTFLKSMTRFESAARVSDADVPNDNQAALPYPDQP